MVFGKAEDNTRLGNSKRTAYTRVITKNTAWIHKTLNFSIQIDIAKYHNVLRPKQVIGVPLTNEMG